MKAWRDIWSAGQGVGNIQDILPVAEIIERLKQEYRTALDACSSTETAYV